MSDGLPLHSLFSLGWRNLWRNSRRTLIMLSAIAIGVWAMIFMTALMRGMVDQMVTDGVRNLPGHVQVHHPEYRDDPNIENSMPEPDESFAAALGQPPAVAWTSRIRVPAMISSERDSRGVTLLGVDPAGEVALGFDADSIVEGRFLEGPDDRGLVVGRKLLERLETETGKRVVVMSQDPDNNVADRGIRIVGVYSAKLPSLEEQFIYTGRETAQAFLKLPGQVSELAVLGNDYRDVSALLEQVRTAAGPGLSVEDWQTIDGYLGTMLTFMDGFVLIWIIVVFLALSFGLVNTLMMAVFERIREFGLMQALGMKPGAIMRLVLMESVTLLMLGLLLGNALAVGTILPLQSGIDVSAVSQGMEMAGMGSTLYPALKLDDMLLANVVVITLGVITSLLPAWRASLYEPVEAIAKI